MPNQFDTPASVLTRRAKIAQIADVLGLPVDAFFDGAGPHSDLDDAAELLRLWLQVRSADKRRTVLEFIRTVVTRQPEVP